MNLLDNTIKAIEKRIEWCKLIGLDQLEIEESIKLDPPENIEEEQKELEAAIRLSKN
jgi:hypothetical protein